MIVTQGVKGFKDFIKNQGVLTFAIGFILGGAVSKFVSSFVTDIMNPILSGLLGGVGDLSSAVFYIGKATIHYGTFINTGIDFLVIALVVYIGVKILGINEKQIKK